MSSASAPFGLRPAYHPSGTIRPKVGSITSGSANNVFMNSPCRIDLTTGDILQAAAGARAVGSFQGVQYVDSTGRFRVSNWWASGTVGTQVEAFYTDDPWITYQIQANGSVARSSLGAMGNWTALSGDTLTGLSTVMLDTATLADTIFGLQIVGLTPGPDNNWGDAFTIVDVQIAMHQFVTNRPSLA